MNGAFVLGILSAYKYILGTILIPVTILITFWIICFRKQFLLPTILICLSVILGWGVFSIQDTTLNESERVAIALEGRLVHASGIVDDISETNSGKYRIRLTNAFFYNDSINVHSSLACFLYINSRPMVEYGDSLEVYGTFLQFQKKRNPGQFNLRQFYQRKGIFGLLLPEDGLEIIVRRNHRKSFQGLVYDIRNRISAIFYRCLHRNDAGLLTALILGDKSGLDPALKSQFQSIGVVHVLAVSGLHVGYIVLILSTIVSLMKIPWGYDKIVIMIGLLFYAGITGFTPSVSRACLMAGLYMIGLLLNRNANPWNIISASSYVILVVKPHQLFDLGFILSFSAVISIIFFYKEINRILPDVLKVENIPWLGLRFFWALFLVSFSAQIGTLPVTLLTFGKLPIVALIANVIIVPLIGVLVALGIVLLGISWVPILPWIYSEAIWIDSLVIQYISNFFSSIEHGVINASGFQNYHVFIYILGLIILILYGRRKIGLASLFLCILVNLSIWKWVITDHTMDIVFIDVGQGDSAVIKLPNGKTMLVDTGYRSRKVDMGKEMVVPVLNHLGIRQINWLVLSHPHSDHIGGTMSVLEAVYADTLIDTDIHYGSFTYNQILETVDRDQIVYLNGFATKTMRLDNQIYLQFFHPDTSHEVDHNINNRSLVFKLIHGKNTILFTGDAELEAEADMLRFGSSLESDIIKVGHHGSITSTSTEFLNLVNPQTAVISVGEKNKFNHPSHVVVERLQSHGCSVLRTDESGAIWFRSDGRSFKRILWN